MTVHDQELARFRSPLRSCGYLPEERASLDYRVYAAMPADRYRELLRRGWRRHGAHFFRPACPACRKCRSLRIVVEEFRPSRSQRRILRDNRDVEVVLQSPTVTSEHVRLYNDYHHDMSARRGWPRNRTTPDDYGRSFLIGEWPFAREILYLRESRLIGVGLVDVVDDALSSVYFFHDPAWRPRAPGSFSILQEIEFCRSTGRAYNYLGYCIADCPSMAYKANFRPHEILDAYVSEQEEPTWRRSGR